MTLKRISMVLVLLVAVATTAYFSLRVHSTKSYFSDAVVVTYNRPVVGNDTVSFAFRKPGNYVVTFLPSPDAKNSDQMPLPFVVMVGDKPEYKVIEQKAIPQPMIVTIVSTSAGVSLHQFP